MCQFEVGHVPVTKNLTSFCVTFILLYGNFNLDRFPVPLSFTTFCVMQNLTWVMADFRVNFKITQFETLFNNYLYQIKFNTKIAIYDFQNNINLKLTPWDLIKEKIFSTHICTSLFVSHILATKAKQATHVLKSQASHSRLFKLHQPCMGS